MTTLFVTLLVAALSLVAGQEATYPFTVRCNHTWSILAATRPCWNSYDPAPAVQQAVQYQDASGTALQGYVTYNNKTSTARPVVVIIPDYDGIGPYELWRAKLLAEMGYVGFVADIYGSSQLQGPSLPTANRTALDQAYIANPPLLLERIYAALSQVRLTPQADATKMVVIGYCFGGGAILDVVRAWPNGNLTGVLGVMGFHAAPLNPMGGIGNVTKGCPIRVSIQQGFDDPTITSPTSVQTLQTELDSANVTWEYFNYGKTVHAFTEPDLVNTGSTMMAYNLVADQRSWWALRGYLLDVFGTANSVDFYTILGQYDYQSTFATSIAPGASAPAVAAALAPVSNA